MPISSTEVSIVRDRFGHYIQTIFHTSSNNNEVDFPTHFCEHIKRVEDQGFDSHWGINFRGIIRAIYVNFSSLRIRQGGSSITQQYIRGHLPIKFRFVRKAIELILSPLATILIGRKNILSGYIRTVYWGQCVRGGAGASQLYFGKPLKSISSSESLILSSMLSRPNYWLKHPEHLAKKTQSIAIRDSLTIHHGRTRNVTRCIAKRNAKTIQGKFPSQYFNSLLRKKNKIQTTLNLRLNQALEKSMLRQGMHECVGAIINYRKWEIHAISNTDIHSKQYPVLDSKYLRLGSLLKPFLLIAYHRKGIDPDSFFLDSEEMRIEYPKNKTWRIRNYKNIYRGTISLSDAIVYSDNTACVRALIHIGLDSFKTVLVDYDILDEGQEITPSIILGTSLDGIELIRVLKAYAIFASCKWISGNPFALGKSFQRLNDEQLGEIVCVRRVLKKVVQVGTARELTRIGAQGGKTGSEQDVTNLIYYDDRGLLYFFSERTKGFSRWIELKGATLVSMARRVRKSISREINNVLTASFKGSDIYASTKRAA